ncbi:heat-shock protein Hsp20 [Ferrigenium kumadai]|uniref:Heat-shock protein Hsp20 n=1 Tax=Ferrigenium kumadai TaxID=1682490 RepID=A0AAN1SXX4_9PROT|nr:Hsp20/alpha crystallin family protein [Ferrigenium kumadai]BBI98998.1 heat-shock protein Hsp20 [Ferrigenium kumadai]
MANLTRFDPFSEMTRFEPFRDMNDMMKGFMMRPMLREMSMEPQIKMEVSEVEGAYKVKAEIPGVKKEDIHVSIEGNRVSISAEVKQEKEEKEGERLICCERSYGKTFRSFTLDHEVDEASAQAKYNDGVLEIMLPKKSGGGVKELTVS